MQFSVLVNIEEFCMGKLTDSISLCSLFIWEFATSRVRWCCSCTLINNCQFVNGRHVPSNALVCTYRVHLFIFLAQYLKSIKQDEEIPNAAVSRNDVLFLVSTNAAMWLVGRTLRFGTTKKRVISYLAFVV